MAASRQEMRRWPATSPAAASDRQIRTVQSAGRVPESAAPAIPAPSASHNYSVDSHPTDSRTKPRSTAPPDRTRAAIAVLDRGWGKPAQPVNANVSVFDQMTDYEQKTMLAALAALNDD